MKRPKPLLQARREFVKNYVENSASKTTKSVEKLSKRLFLAKSTIWNDLSY